METNKYVSNRAVKAMYAILKKGRYLNLLQINYICLTKLWYLCCYLGARSGVLVT
jgi:hypothetical protein